MRRFPERTAATLRLDIIICERPPAPARNRREILDSRVDSTRAIGRAIAAAKRPPRVWLQASSATTYAHRYDAANDEHTGIMGGSERDAPSTWRFSTDVVHAWERALDEAETPHTRKIAMRSALTLSPDRGGVFDTLLGLTRHGLGGTAGNGMQYVSWIHEFDFVRAVRWLVDRGDLAGVVNLAAPHPCPNAKFMRTLRAAYGTAFGLPAATWMLEAGAAIMGTETELILKSRRVVPARLLESGFTFVYQQWSAAAGELCDRWKAMRTARSFGCGSRSALVASRKTGRPQPPRSERYAVRSERRRCTRPH